VLGVLVVLALTGGGAAACTGDDGPPPPPAVEKPAAELAEALASGDFSQAALRGVSAAQAGEVWERVTSGLSPLQADYEVVSAQVDPAQEGEASPPPPTATARFQASWRSPGQEEPVWQYETTARFELVGDAWQADWDPALIEEHVGMGDQLVAKFTNAKRGDIVTAAGEPIVTERPVVNVGINKPDATGDLAAQARKLAERLGADPDAYAARVEASGPQAFVSALTIRAEDLPDYDLSGFGPELYQQETTLPLAPTREFARQLLGTVGEATAEVIENSDGQIAAGDLVGLSGLQQAYDQHLRGERGLEITLAGEAEETVLASVPPTAGANLALTLDPALQQAADAALAGVEGAAALVAVKPSTGEVLALASGPGGGGYSTANLGLYPPGSTFKVVTTLALLRAGVTPDTPVACPSTVTVDGRVFANYSDYPSSATGQIPLRTAVAQSCNTAFIGQAGTVSLQLLADAARDLGVTGPFALGVDSPAGSVPLDGGKTEQAAALIGQGKVQVTPLAMAVAAASIGAGHRVIPSLVVDPPVTSAETPGGEGINAAEADDIGQMMRGVVTEGSGSLLASLGGEVRAKTGTAEFGTGTPPPTHAWMIAIDGDLAVAVFVEQGASGAKTAGPIVKQFLTAAR
jgi:cell division protein FtsI/penicillin-binding protein 2